MLEDQRPYSRLEREVNEIVQREWAKHSGPPMSAPYCVCGHSAFNHSEFGCLINDGDWCGCDAYQPVRRTHH